MAGPSRPLKRVRAEELEGGFWEAEHSGSEGDYLTIKLTSGIPLKSKGWFWIQKCLRNVLGEKEKLEKADLLRDGSLLVKTKSKTQTEKLMKLKRLQGEEWEIQRNEKLNTSKGTIFAPDLIELEEGEILEWMAEYGVKEVRRFTKKTREGKTENTPILLLTFDSSSCPEKIKLDYISYTVRKHIPNPIMCFKCGKLGHIKENCKNEEICLECGETKHEGRCQGDKRCVNCNQQGHSCLNRKVCREWIKGKEICAIKVDMDISYMQAKKEYERRHSTPTHLPYSGAVRNVSEAQKTDDLKQQVESMNRRMDEMMRMMGELMGRDLGDRTSQGQNEKRHETKPDETKEKEQSTKVQSEQDVVVETDKDVVNETQTSRTQGEVAMQSEESQEESEMDVIPPSQRCEWRIANRQKKTDRKQHEISGSDDSESEISSIELANKKNPDKNERGNNTIEYRRSWK